MDGSWWQAQVRLEVESVLGKFTEFGNSQNGPDIKIVYIYLALVLAYFTRLSDPVRKCLDPLDIVF